MTNQNVVVPAGAVTLPVPPASTVPVSGGSSPLLPCGRAARTGASLKRKYMQQQLEIASAAWAAAAPRAGAASGCGAVAAAGPVDMSAWVEAMSASSPTAVAARGHAAAKDLMETWMASHPSALSTFEEIGRVSKGKRIVVFLDYDGTLSPIVNDPDMAFMSDAMRKTVQDVARCFPTAIVSGRCIDKVYSFVQLSELYYAGSHGMDIKGPAVAPAPDTDADADVHSNGQPQPVLFQPAARFVPMIQELYKVLKDKTRSIPGAIVETNKFCLSVHFRCVEEKRWGGLEELVRATLQSYPHLKLTRGRKVLEVRPCIEWDKGKALEFLLGALGMDTLENATGGADGDDDVVLPIYVGDDRTDEDAFRVLNQRGAGIGILVSKVPRETAAAYSLRDPTEVMDFLDRLVDWNKKQQHQQIPRTPKV